MLRKILSSNLNLFLALNETLDGFSCQDRLTEKFFMMIVRSCRHVRLDPLKNLRYFFLFFALK